MNTETIERLVKVDETSQVGALALISLSPEKYAAEVYQPYKSKLSAAIDSVRAIDYDITTTAGMTSAIKFRAIFRDLRVATDKECKARKEPITKIGKLLESGFNQVEERIAPLEELFDADIKAEEARKDAEKASKIAAERARVDSIHSLIQEMYNFQIDLTLSSSEFRRMIEGLKPYHPESLPDKSFAEFLENAVSAYELRLNTLNSLETSAHVKEVIEAQARAEREAERSRLAEETAALKIEREQIAKERAERADKIMEQERQMKIIQLEQRRAEQAEKAAREREFAEQKAAHAAEMKLASDKLAADQQAFAMQQKAAINAAVTNDASTEFVTPTHLIEEDHVEALAMNVQLSAPSVLDDIGDFLRAPLIVNDQPTEVNFFRRRGMSEWVEMTMPIEKVKESEVGQVLEYRTLYTKPQPSDATKYLSRDEFHDKAWALYHAKTFDDTQLAKVNIHTIRSVFNAVFDAMIGVDSNG